MAIILIFMAGGYDSRDGFTSCEWTRKQSWPY